MAESHSIVITSVTPSGRTASKAITFVDPNASAEKMYALAVGLNGLTENTLSAIERVDRVDIPQYTRNLPFPSVTITCGDQTWTNAEFDTSFNQTLRIFTGWSGVTHADGKYTATITFTNGSALSVMPSLSETGKLSYSYGVESTSGTMPDGNGVLTISIPDDATVLDYEGYITLGTNATFTNRNFSVDVYFTNDESHGGLDN